jgi:hypothetical protein
MFSPIRRSHDSSQDTDIMECKLADFRETLHENKLLRFNLQNLQGTMSKPSVRHMSTCFSLLEKNSEICYDVKIMPYSTSYVH